ncbi:MAG: cytochrome c biogenesis CcdA family protein, partial [Rubrobacteraceae bacterium]
KRPMAVEASFLASCLGGVLSLLSPCSALLLPAFFAYAFSGGRELLKKTVLFYVGLCVTLAPLGMGISAVSSLFYGQRNLLITVSGLLIITFGSLILFGGGFAVGPLERLRGKIRGDSAGAVFALGAIYGFAGFCSGPILGAILTVAAASGGAAQGAFLLATYALGMAMPLFVLALLWERLDIGRRRWLRGRELSLGPLRLHTTNLLSGLMFIALGTVFMVYEGTSALTGFYESRGASDIAFAAEEWARGVAGVAPPWVPILILAVVASGALLWWHFRDEEPKKSRKESA